MEAEGEDGKDETVEHIKEDKGKNKVPTNMEIEKEGEKTERPQDQNQMETDPQQDKRSEEEQVMKRLLQ